MRRTHVFIVGAGFSQYAGLPLQKGFTEALLAPDDERTDAMQSLVDYLKTFVHDAFNHSKTAPSSFWPNLEDIFH